MSDVKPYYTIAVTGLNAVDNPGPGVPVVRSLKEATSFSCRIVGLCYELMEPGAYMHDLVDVCYQVPYPSAGTEALLSRLDYINEKEHIDVIIPNFDAELFSYIKLEQDLRERHIAMFLPTLEQFEERQKFNLHDFGKRVGLEVPRSINCDTMDDFLAKSDRSEWNYPLVVKGRFYEAYVVHDDGQFVANFGKIAAKWGTPVIVQQFVEGSEFNVIGFGSADSKLLAAVPMRKQFITDKGKAWAGITVSDSRLVDMARRFVEASGWRGGFELELMRGRDGNAYVLEINPRIPAWVYLATAAGQNIPELLVNAALGKEVKAFDKYDEGKMFVRCSWDMIVDQEEFGAFSVSGEKDNRKK